MEFKKDFFENVLYMRDSLSFEESLLCKAVSVHLSGLSYNCVADVLRSQLFNAIMLMIA